MTIVAAAAAPDGIVLAADSRTTYTSGRRHRVSSDHALKLYVPCNGIGIATFGAALIRGQTIVGLLELFAAQRSKKSGTAVLDVATEVSAYFQLVIDEAVAAGDPQPPPGALGFLVAGYDTAGVGHVVEVLLPRSHSRAAVVEHGITTRDGGVLFRGRTRYIRRMLEGYDKDGIAQAKIDVPRPTVHGLRRLGYVLKRIVSTQDALDFVTFVVRITVDMDRMTDGTWAEQGGVPTCGGQMQALLVTRNDSKWIVRTPLEPRAAGSSG